LTVDGIKNIEDIRVGDWVIADDQTTPEEIEAKDLTVGSLLQTEDGRIVDVDGVEKREGKFPVYNFRVEGIPTYFVSELGALVYNTCGDVVEPGRLTPQEAEQIQRVADNYNTEIHVVGSRAGGRGRNIDTDLQLLMRDSRLHLCTIISQIIE